MSIIIKFLLCVALLVSPVTSGKVCSYVANDDCLPEWGCVDFYDEYINTSEDGSMKSYDYDCGGIQNCPVTPTEENEGVICEADAPWADTNQVKFEWAAGTVFDHTMPEGTDQSLNNCYDSDVYEVVCVDAPTTTELETTEAASPSGKVCSYVANDDCLPEWGCVDFYDEYINTSDDGSMKSYDYDCGGIQNCPVTPTEENEGVICEADAPWADTNQVKFEWAAGTVFDHTMPEGTDQSLNNCYDSDVYEVVCVDAPECLMEPKDGCDGFCTSSCTQMYSSVADGCPENECSPAVLCAECPTPKAQCDGEFESLLQCYPEASDWEPPTTTELETTEAASHELCATYTSAASCPASYCVIKNDRNGDFKKCKRVQCKTFSADEAACEASAECQPKYKFGAFINKCLLKKNLD